MSNRRKHEPKFGKKKNIRVKVRILCKQAKKAKMRFDSQKNADLFLYYAMESDNSDFPNKPIRSYHCHTCRAWHVTSKPSYSESSNSLAELLLEMHMPEGVD